MNVMIMTNVFSDSNSSISARSVSPADRSIFLVSGLLRFRFRIFLFHHSTARNMIPDVAIMIANGTMVGMSKSSIFDVGS